MEKGDRRRPFAGGKGVAAVLLALLLGGGGFLAWRWPGADRGGKGPFLPATEAEKATEATGGPAIGPEEEAAATEAPETEAPYVSPIDFEALWAENPDTVGWIRIPDTVVDYPIVQDPNDNERYLHLDFHGNESVYGTIYLDCDSDPDFSGWNNPIYGHHMKDGSMFKALEYFKDEDYFKDHQYFDIYTPERAIHLKAVACYYGSADGIVRKTKFESREDFDGWLKDRLEPCRFAQVPEAPVDSVFVLVTCSYEMKNARTFLFAVEVDGAPDPGLCPP